jgi:hypothetical protein
LSLLLKNKIKILKTYELDWTIFFSAVRQKILDIAVSRPIFALICDDFWLVFSTISWFALKYSATLKNAILIGLL